MRKLVLTITLVLVLVSATAAQTPDTLIPLVFRDHVEPVELSRAQAEYLELRLVRPLTLAQQARLTALVLALGTRYGCTKQQERADLCRQAGQAFVELPPPPKQ
jgi:hypothetical protein